MADNPETPVAANSNLVQLVLGYVRERGLNWGPSVFLVTYQILLLAILPFYLYYSMPSLGIWLVSIVLLYLTGLSITAGYHRFYAHKAYKVNPVVEYLLLFFGTMSAQGSVLRWCYDHRLHHAHVDTDKDPYNINNGFWYAHFLWILGKPNAIDTKVVPDLARNRAVMFQHNYYPYLMVLSNGMACAAVAWLFSDFWGAFFIATWLRMFALHHFTWFINSLAHTWGDKPFCQEQTAVDNYIIALLTFGEGYHNFHHTFANDYRNGIRWYHFDPTKWLIWTLSKLGLANGLKSVDATSISKRIVLERKELLMGRLRDLWYVKKEELSCQIDAISDKIIAELAQYNTLMEEYRLRKSHELRMEIKALKRRLRDDWKQWSLLSHEIMRLKPLPA